MKSCEHCNGTGKAPEVSKKNEPARSETCPKCSGTGFTGFIAADESGPTPTTGGDTGE